MSKNKPATAGTLHRIAVHLAFAVTLLGFGTARADEVMFCSGFEAVDCQITADTLAPVILEAEPGAMIVEPGHIPDIGARFVEEGSGLNPASIRLVHDDIDVTAQITLADGVVRYSLPAPPVPGRHRWRIEGRDVAGNLAVLDWNYDVTSRPVISGIAPNELEIEPSATEVVATIVDNGAELNPESVALLVDGIEIAAQDFVEVIDDHRLEVRWAPATPMAAGRHAIELRASNQHLATATALWGFWILDPPIYEFAFIDGATQLTTQVPFTSISVNAASNRATVTSVLINGEIADIAAGVDNRAYYTRDVQLIPGANTISAVVGFSDGETRTLTRTITYDAPPIVTITAPIDFVTLGPTSQPSPAGGATDLTGNVEHPARITGTLNRPVERVEINQRGATLNAAGTAFSFENYFLHEGTNVLTAIATTADGRTGTATTTVYVDHTAPLLLIEGPADDSVTSTSRVDLRGSVSDAVSGVVGTSEPVVVVRNLANGTTTTASVYQQFFLAQDVALEVGANTLEISATDGAGNVRTQQMRVSRVAVGSQRVVLYSGQRQSGLVGSELAKPLVVHVLDAQGAPIVGTPVRFDILRGDGRLAAAAGTPQTGDGLTPARNVEVQTDAQGVARIWFTLGSESGLAANVVRAHADGIVEEVLFSASGQRGLPAWVLPDGATGTQFAEANSRAIEPLTVVVYDEHRNRVENATIEYRIARGDARFDAQSWPGATPAADGLSLRVQTDRNGIASARPWLGFNEGDVRIVASAVDGDDARSAVFELQVMMRGEGDTSFTGTVLDHTGKPIPGVSMSIVRANPTMSTTTDANGVFRFESQVPPGKIDLMIDGRLAPAPAGTWYPELHFEAAVVRGRDNQMPHAVYLPPVDQTREKVVGGNEDVVLTVPGLEGFELVVKANSVTFQDGSHVGPLVLSTVNVDRLPMVPTGGSATFGPVAWTLQPSKTRFDPPIEVRIPNTGGLSPGETITIVQWDHDLATFVPMGLGTVNEDATQIVSNAGSGITKAGWGGCTGDCPPPPPNCGASSDAPKQPGYQNIKAFNVFMPLLGFYLQAVPITDLERISKNATVRYEDRTYRLENTWFTEDRCDSVEFDWSFGDGGLGSGERVEHDYEIRGSMTLKETIVCHYRAKCDGSPGTVRWPKDFAIRLRDTAWIEFKDAMDSCNWTAECWLIHRVTEELHEITQLMGMIEIDWLTEIRDWNRETIDMMGPGASQVPSEGKLATLAVLHAANETVFPVSLLDVIPVGKFTKATKLARGKYGASLDEVAELARRAARNCNPARSAGESDAVLVDLCEFPWQRFETAGRNFFGKIRCPGGECLASWKPARNTVNGFDGAVVYRAADGRLRLGLTESKHWWKKRDTLVPADLTAFGFNGNPNTLRQNLDVVIATLREPGFVRNATDADILQLIGDINANKFDIAVHVVVETNVDWPALQAAVRAFNQTSLIPMTGWGPS